MKYVRYIPVIAFFLFAVCLSFTTPVLATNSPGKASPCFVYGGVATLKGSIFNNECNVSIGSVACEGSAQIKNHNYCANCAPAKDTACTAALNGNVSTLVVVRPCSDTTYSNQHIDLCACEYDSARGVYNGNTYTALGCFPSNIGSFLNIAISVVIVIATLVAMFFVVIGGYEIMTNPAGPDEVKEGRAYVTNAVIGLLVIMFCVVILKIVGIDILGINELTNIFK